MASAQVLPNSAASSRKLEHLEAGKRKLEEFRKKKAAGRAKNSASSTHLSTANVDQHDKQPLDNQIVRLMHSNGAGSSDGASETVVEPSHVFIDDENKVNDFVQNNELGSYYTNAKPPLKANYYNEYSAETIQTPAKDQEFDRYNPLHTAGMVNVNYSPQPQEKNDDFSFYSGASGRHTSHDTAGNVSPENSSSFLLQNKFGYTSPQAVGQMSSYEDSFHPPTEIKSSFDVGRDMHAVLESNNSMTSDMGESKLNNSVGHNLSGNSLPLWPSESRSTAFSYDARSSSDHVPLYLSVAETNARRSRPSFLDSINIPKVSHTEPGRVPLFSSKAQETDAVPSSAFEKSFTRNETIQSFSNSRASNVTSAFENSMATAVTAGNGDDMYRHTVNDNNLERKHDPYSQKQDEDFAALEQHIEDLTQEKFSLQRALEASRALAESLATENSSLTDSYNQQGSVVNQLKIDMEKLQEDIKVHLVELESVKMEYANAQLECNAADERSKLLASEVIGLEEKALRLRSSELKLERQLENSQAEISSFKKKISSLEKERQDFQSTIDALQEEKKMLQAKLRKVSSNGKFIDPSKNSNKKDASTSTGDLIPEDNTDSTTDNSNLEMHNTAPLLGTDASSSSLLPESRQFNLEVSSLNIPPDQIRTIQNIHTLISELALEKEELMQALLAESSEFSNLKELNNELSRKLEAQTQRLELLTAQSMANENIPTRPPDPRSMPESAPYADEGDEVVERVLGWIMKLFPGGPSRRRTSKLL